MSKTKTPYEPSARSPFAGCAIFIVAAAMLVFLVGFSVYALFRQSNEIAKFTAEKPVPIEVAQTQGNESEVHDLEQRVAQFNQQLQGDSEASLALSADDLNLAIATDDAFKELRGTFYVTEIDAKNMRIAISYTINGRPRFARGNEQGWITSDRRYLNATLIAQPGLLKREVVLEIDAIDVPGATVPSGFIGQMSPYRITERYLTDKNIGPAMAKLTRVGLVDGKLVFTRNPKENPVDMITNAQVDAASKRLFTFLGIAATLFLVFAAIIILISLRMKNRRNHEP